MTFNKEENIQQLHLFLEASKNLRKIKASSHMNTDEKFEWARTCVSALENDCYQDLLINLAIHEYPKDYNEWKEILSPYKSELDHIEHILAHPNPEGFKELANSIFGA